MVIQTVREVHRMAERMGIGLHLSRRHAQPLGEAKTLHGIHVHPDEEESVRAGDITMAIGGDGTMLKAANLARVISRPLLGINSGKLGFLANIQRQNMKRALEAVLSKNYELDSRWFLQAVLSDGSTRYALNEFVFSRTGSLSMITITAEYDGSLINRYWADGIIVSSPTGSTAYNLSTGGPIVLPQTGVMVLTPISPHTLTTRPLVLPAGKNLIIKIDPPDQEVLFSVDGKNFDLPADSPVVSIRQSDQTIDLIKLHGQSYFETLRNKLMWGMDVRGE